MKSVCFVILLTIDPGGGGHSPQSLVGTVYVPRQSEKWAAPERLERENAGLRSVLERESGGGGSPEVTVGHVWLELWPAPINPGALPNALRSWAAMDGLNVKKF